MSRSTKSTTLAIGGGTLKISTSLAKIELQELCEFALRNNPNRKLLVVSKVAGRHIPVRPQASWEAFSLLAKQIPPTLPAPIVFIGLAESAIGLGHGVYEAYRQKSNHQDMMFIHSSRHKLDRPVYVYFEEEHSHATQEYLYQPAQTALDDKFRAAQSVVIVDDELTTGKTIHNLARFLMNHMPHLKKIVVANLTDWRSSEHKASFAAIMPTESEVVSLLEGELEYLGGPTVQKMPPLFGNGQSKDNIVSAQFGRLGIEQLQLSPHLIQSAYDIARKGKTLILATEEFAFPPLLLATKLEKLGANVYYQSTTRTPIIVGEGAVKCALKFRDNYGDGITNFVYNLAPDMYDQVIICHETPRVNLDSTLIQSLRAHTLKFA